MTERAVLLDTHTLFWLAHEPHRVSAPVLDVLGHEDTIVFVSAVSAYELANKHRLGKWPTAGPMLANWSKDLERLWVQEIGIQAEHALQAGALDWAHRDPFDRLLAAQAIAMSIPLVSGDVVMSTAPGLDVLW